MLSRAPPPRGCGAVPRRSGPSRRARQRRSRGPPRGTGRSRAPAEEELRQLLAVDDVAQVAAGCRDARRRLGLATGLWTTAAVARVLDRSVVEYGSPAEAAVPAVLALAADSETRGPGRLPCPGPWWEAAERARPPVPGAFS